jgi:hypothetical protein
MESSFKPFKTEDKSDASEPSTCKIPDRAAMLPHHLAREASRLEYIAARLNEYMRSIDIHVSGICNGFMQIAKELQTSHPCAECHDYQPAVEAQPTSVQPLTANERVRAEIMKLIVQFQFHDALSQGLCQLISDIREVENSVSLLAGSRSTNDVQALGMRPVGWARQTHDVLLPNRDLHSDDNIVLF